MNLNETPIQAIGARLFLLTSLGVIGEQKTKTMVMFCEGVLVEACLFIVFLDASIFPTTMVLEQEKQRDVGFVSSVI